MRSSLRQLVPGSVSWKCSALSPSKVSAILHVTPSAPSMNAPATCRSSRSNSAVHRELEDLVATAQQCHQDGVAGSQHIQPRGATDRSCKAHNGESGAASSSPDLSLRSLPAANSPWLPQAGHQVTVHLESSRQESNGPRSGVSCLFIGLRLHIHATTRC